MVQQGEAAVACNGCVKRAKGSRGEAENCTTGIQVILPTDIP